MIIFNTVIVTLVAIFLLTLLLLKLGLPYARKILQVATDVCCYINTYHYNKNEWERITIGQDLFYELLKVKGKAIINKNKTDFIFWALYTQYYNKLLDTIPISLSQHSFRTLSEGEDRGIEKFLDDYLYNQKEEYKNYATENEIQRHKASNINEAEQ